MKLTIREPNQQVHLLQYYTCNKENSEMLFKWILEPVLNKTQKQVSCLCIQCIAFPICKCLPGKCAEIKNVWKDCVYSCSVILASDIKAVTSHWAR